MDKRISRGISALLSLIFSLVIQQKKTLISIIVIFFILIIPMDIFSILDPTNIFIRLFVDGLPTMTVAFLPIMILLVFLPTIHEQIYGSSLVKRMKSTGITPLIYISAVSIIFGLLALAIYYILSIVSLLMFAWSMSTYEINWFNFVIMPIFYIIIFTSTGLFIGSLKLSQIVKGVIIFTFIIFIFVTGYTLISPDEFLQTYSQISVAYWILFLNPWALTMFSMKSAFSNTASMGLDATIITTIYIISIAFLFVSITLFKMRND